MSIDYLALLHNENTSNGKCVKCQKGFTHFTHLDESTTKCKKPPTPLTAPTDPFLLCATRTQMFIERGLNKDLAGELAAHLRLRDSQYDDRRACAECISHFAGRCSKRLSPVGMATPFTVHRCPGFTDVYRSQKPKFPNDFVFKGEHG